MRVLIVDDDPALRGLLRMWTEAEGASVTEASTAEQALAIARSVPEPMAAAFCDLRLPGMGGVEALLAILREQDPRAHDRARRVAKLAVALALTLQVGEPQLSDVERAA